MLTDYRDQVFDEQAPWVREQAIKEMLIKGWREERILGEFPMVSEATVRAIAARIAN